jgi:hypothetical protein
MTGQSIRDFFSNLFHSRKLEELKALHNRELARLNRALAKQEKDSEALLAEARRERDYFRGKCDRFELLLLTPKPTAPIVPRRPGMPGPVVQRTGRWLQVQLDDLAKQDEELRKKAEADAQRAAAETAGPAAKQSA